jgi:fatty-acyl-CoA synthase
MQGYYRNSAATEAIVDGDGWLYTGDTATMDEAGYVRIAGRKRDLIKRGGLTIFPAEVENYLHRHPCVQEVAVIGVPDAVLGERCWAYVCLKSDATETDLQDFCRGQIADYKIPERFVFVSELPLTPSGKVRKDELRARSVRKV